VWLNQHGIRLAEVRIVPDDIERIAAAVNELRVVHDYLFTTGGIGPTHDDITVDAMAHAFGVPVVIHPEARGILENYYRDRPGGLTEARLRMARVPEGAELLPNPSSGAPGVKMDNVYIMAGVPGITASMLEGLTGKLKGGKPIVSVTVHVVVLIGAALLASWKLARFEIRGGEIVEHESAPADQRESIGSKDHTSSHGDFPVSPARAQRPGGPTTEEEMRGAQPPNGDLGNPGVEHETRQTGKTAEVVDLDEVNEAGSGRSARWSHDP